MTRLDTILIGAVLLGVGAAIAGGPAATPWMTSTISGPARVIDGVA
jgi:hypothetical protein